MEKEIMKKEAIKRLKSFDELMPQVIKDFEEDDVINISTNTPLGPGILYHADEEQQKLIKQVEDQYGGLVYHGILVNTTAGKMLNLLWVSKYKEEWEMENNDLEYGIVFCYVYNLDVPEFSEFGSISYRQANGGLARVF